MLMELNDIIMSALKKNGNTECIDILDLQFSKLLRSVQDRLPDVYEEFVRDTYEGIYGHHYNEKYALRDVEMLKYNDRTGCLRHGAHWDIDEVATLTAGMVFPTKTTLYDRYVALNVAYSYFCQKFRDETIINLAFMMFFKDKRNIWDYMTKFFNVSASF